MNCYIRTHNATNQYLDGGGISLSSRIIGIKSRAIINGRENILDHTEFQFSERYDGISVSATMRDNCRCVRFKLINYDKHPSRWLTQVVVLTDEQEDLIFKEACSKADENIIVGTLVKKYNIQGACLYGPKAMKYDLIGVVICNINHRRIIPGGKNRVWCTEFVVMLIKLAYPEFNGHPDTQRPDTLYKEWEKYNLLLSRAFTM